MNSATNSFRASVPSLTPLLAEENTPPTRWIAVIISLDSTANCPATALIDPRAPSNSDVCNLNCLKAAIAPYVVFLRLSNVGAKSALARASNAILVTVADKPA